MCAYSLSQREMFFLFMVKTIKFSIQLTNGRHKIAKWLQTKPHLPALTLSAGRRAVNQNSPGFHRCSITDQHPILERGNTLSASWSDNISLQPKLDLPLSSRSRNLTNKQISWSRLCRPVEQNVVVVSSSYCTISRSQLRTCRVLRPDMSEHGETADNGEEHSEYFSSATATSSAHLLSSHPLTSRRKMLKNACITVSLNPPALLTWGWRRPDRDQTWLSHPGGQSWVTLEVRDE